MADRCITVNVVLASGRSTLLSAEPSCSIAELKAAAQREFGHGFLTLLSEDGRQWNSICWCFFDKRMSDLPNDFRFKVGESSDSMSPFSGDWNPQSHWRLWAFLMAIT